jgi:predicted RNA-binding protein YlqC (UPF0109 family)
MTTTTTDATPAQTAREFFRKLILGYTQHENDLEVSAGDLPGRIVITVRANRDDHPRIVGTRGAHIMALQSIAAAYGRRNNTKIALTLLEPVRGEKAQLRPFEAAENWNEGETMELMNELLDRTTPQGWHADHVAVAELSTIQITRADGEPVPADFVQSLHLLFHAIGKNQGRQIHVTA